MQFLRSLNLYKNISKLSSHVHPLQLRSRAVSSKTLTTKIPPPPNHPSKKIKAKQKTPVDSKFDKHQRGRMKGESSSGNQVSFGKYALQALEPAWITAKQIDAGRKVITRYKHRAAKMWVRVVADKCVTGRPVGVRMGRGKGPFKYTAAVVKPGRILYEISGVSEMVAKEAITEAGSKFPMRTQFINGSLTSNVTFGISPAKRLALSKSQSDANYSGFSPVCAQKNGLLKMPYQSVGLPTCVSGVSSVRAYSSFYGKQGDVSIGMGLNVDNSDGIGSDGGNTLKNVWQSVAASESFLQQKAEAHSPHVDGIGGVAVSVGNVLSWLSMQFTNPFSAGNTIQAGSLEGKLVEMGHSMTPILNAGKFP